MKRIVPIAVLICLISVQAHAYRLPNYRIADADWKRPAEVVFGEYDRAMIEVTGMARLGKIAHHRRHHHKRLNPSERAALVRLGEIEVPHEFWRYVVDLKRDLVKLAEPASAAAVNEADRMAKLVIEKLYGLSHEFKITGSALIHNALVNAGMRDKGFCYHYARELTAVLAARTWRHYEIRWGAAHEGHFLENNGVVVTARGAPFADGIVIDPWRRASKPFWHAVRTDRYPWVEVRDVEDRYDLSK